MTEENERQRLVRDYPAESSYEVQSDLFRHTGTLNDIPKSYLIEREIKAYMHWSTAEELLKRAGSEFDDAREYLKATMNDIVTLSRGREGYNVTTVLGRIPVPKRNEQGYIRENSITPKKLEENKVRQYDEQDYIVQR